MTNKERATAAETALKTFGFAIGAKPNTEMALTVTDLLADLRHYCQQNKISWTECLEQATRNFRMEMIEERGQP